MFDFDFYNNPKPLKMFLCRPDNHKAICELNGINPEGCKLKLVGNNQYELSFTYYRYIENNGERIETNGYDKILIGVEIYVEKFGFFKLKYPPYNDDGDRECKNVTAFSIECELEDKELVDFKINTGEEDSAEYLVTYDNNETESLVNEYTGLPYDYIVFYNTFPEQLTEDLLNKYTDGEYTDEEDIELIKKYCMLIPRLKSKVINTNGELSLVEYVSYVYDENVDGKVNKVILSGFNARVSALIQFYTKYREQLSLICLAIEKCNCNWSVGEIDDSLANKRFQFNVSENIYAFLTNDLAEKTRAIIDFDRTNRKINAVLIENLGTDCGVVLAKNSLINSIDISCNEERLVTRYNVSGGNDIDLKYVNFGDKRIVNIDYFLNAKDDNGNPVYVTTTLKNKYNRYKADVEIAREKYIEYTKQYNGLIKQINELKLRVPNDEVKNDWDTFTIAELQGLVGEYNNLKCTLLTLYNEDYGDLGYTNGEVNEAFMKTTPYWYDYYAYNQVLAQLVVAIETKANDKKYKEIDDSATLAIIKAYETEWTLYGTIELEGKLKAYSDQMKAMIDGGAIIIKANSDYEPKQWSELSTDEKAKFNSLSTNYYYSEYYTVYQNYCNCNTYLNTLYPQLTSLENSANIANTNRKNIAKLVTIDGYNRNSLGALVTLPTYSGNIIFTADEKKTIKSLYIDDSYSNDNILTTSLDDIVSTIDVEKELLEDAVEQLSIVSQPQLNISTSIDNLLAIPEFKDFDFNIYNYVLLEYFKDYYVRLRLYEIEFNPVMPEDEISVVFTNFIKSNSERSDLSYILGQSTGGSGSSGSSGGGSSDRFGSSDDIDITISNTMLSKLLNTEMFGSRVSDVVLNTINVKALTARVATFGDLINGTTTIDGSCVSTGAIKSHNYNGTVTTNANGVKRYGLNNTTGSIIILEDKKINQNDELRDGTFNFGGGKLVWNGTSLVVKGDVSANTLATGLKTGYNDAHDGLFIDKDGNIAIGSMNTVTIDKDGKFNFANGGVVWNGTSLTIKGNITADNGTIGKWDINSQGTYLRGVSLSAEEITYTCELEKKKVGYSNSSYLDKYGFTVHNSYNAPYFYYFVRSANDRNRNFFMLLEEVEKQNMFMNSGAVDIIRVYQGSYQGTHLVGKVISTNHSTDLPVDSLCIIHTTEDSLYKGEVEIISSNDIISAISQSLVSFDDDLGMFSGANDGRYGRPLYETAKSDDGITVYVDNDTSKDNVLLSYVKEEVVMGYTYLTANSGNHIIMPVVAINTQLNNITEEPDFNTSKIILYNNGTIKAVDISVDSVQSDNIISNDIILSNLISDGIQDIMITDKNYSNVSLKNYIEKVVTEMHNNGTI